MFETFFITEKPKRHMTLFHIRWVHDNDTMQNKKECNKYEHPFGTSHVYMYPVCPDSLFDSVSVHQFGCLSICPFVGIVFCLFHLPFIWHSPDTFLKMLIFSIRFVFYIRCLFIMSHYNVCFWWSGRLYVRPYLHPFILLARIPRMFLVSGLCWWANGWRGLPKMSVSYAGKR